MAKFDIEFTLVRTYNNGDKTFKRGQAVKMSELFGANSFWEQNDDDGKGTGVHIVKHWVIEKIAELTGIRTVNGEDGEWVQLGKIENGMTFIKKYVMEDLDGKRKSAIGEANPRNADTAVGLSYMADKRAYDRCVIKLLDLSGKLYSEDENEVMKKGHSKELDNLSDEERKLIAPFQQKLLNAKTEDDVYGVGEEINTFVAEQPISESLKQVLRNSYAKKLDSVRKARTQQSQPKERKPRKPSVQKPVVEKSSEVVEQTPIEAVASKPEKKVITREVKNQNE